MAYEKLKKETYDMLGGVNSKVSPYVNGPTEFRDLTNVHFIKPGSLTQREGTTLYLGVTVSGRLASGYEFERISGASYLIATANTNAYTVTSSFSSFRTGLKNNSLFDFVTFVDRLFMADGDTFFKYDGTNAYSYGLPPGASGWGFTTAVGGGLSGIYVFSWGYLNERGFRGPCAYGLTVNLNGITFGSFRYLGMSTIGGYGVTAIQLYRTEVDGVELVGTTLISGGATTFLDTGASLGSIVCNENLFHLTLAPQFLEIYNNQLFMAGFTTLPSTAYWSQIGEPEGVENSFSAEFRTNDGDVISGLKTYSGNLIVSKTKSLHRLAGDNPSNFFIQEITDQYGCLSNRSMVIWEERLWMLDTKGILEYDAANVKIVSNKVEPWFKEMNLDAAKGNACALHVKNNNEVWFAIPVNGSTLNNRIVVYDYLVNAWTKYEGLSISSLWIAKRSLSQPTPFIGSYTGSISYFGASFTADNGQAITCAVNPYFLDQRGKSTESLYRRLYLDTDVPLGSTQTVTVEFCTNYGTSVVLSRQVSMTAYQQRIDFGIPARSLQPNIYHSSATLPLVLNGYTVESRFQRAV